MRLGEFVFCISGFAVTLVGTVYAVAVLYAGTILTLTVVGLPVFAAGLAGARRLGGGYRRLVELLLHQAVESPPPLPKAEGVTSWVRLRLTDPAGWRALFYLLLRLPAGVLGFLAAAGLPVAGLWIGMRPLWVRSLEPDQVPPSWSLGFAEALTGLVLLLLTPLAVRSASRLNRWLAGLLLGPSPGQ